MKKYLIVFVYALIATITIKSAFASSCTDKKIEPVKKSQVQSAVTVVGNLQTAKVKGEMEAKEMEAFVDGFMSAQLTYEHIPDMFLVDDSGAGEGMPPWRHLEFGHF
jgi:hypothetical protein